MSNFTMFHPTINLCVKDATSKWGYTLFGKPVYLSDGVEFKKGEPAVYYGDFSGLAVKMTENFNIEVLREKFIFSQTRNRAPRSDRVRRLAGGLSLTRKSRTRRRFPFLS